MSEKTAFLEEIRKTIEISVKEAVTAALRTEKPLREKAGKDAYKSTETRLYAYGVMLEKVEDSKERLQDLKQNGLSTNSASLVRFQRSGSRLKPDEILDALIMNLEADIAAGEHELQAVERALQTIEGDQYYSVVAGKYIESKTDEQLAEELYCDPSTVRRNRGRLVRKLAVWFFGADAL